MAIIERHHWIVRVTHWVNVLAVLLMAGSGLRIFNAYPAFARRGESFRCYPWEHRRAYEEEMLGVLLADSRPGQRWPAPADAANLAPTAIRTRLGHATRAVVDRSWSEAAATAGLGGFRPRSAAGCLRCSRRLPQCC